MVAQASEKSDDTFAARQTLAMKTFNLVPQARHRPGSLIAVLILLLIETAVVLWSVRRGGPAKEGVPTVAVLPFSNQSGDAE